MASVDLHNLPTSDALQPLSKVALGNTTWRREGAAGVMFSNPLKKSLRSDFHGLFRAWDVAFATVSTLDE
jgi:hypothetical protein